MSANVYSGDLRNICADLGVSKDYLLSKRLDVANQPEKVIAALSASFASSDAKTRGDGVRKDSQTIHDNASAFLTSSLSKVLAPVTRVSNENYLFVPGRTSGAPLLPVVNKVPFGMQQVEWDVVGLTGEARRIGHGGVRDLTRVGASADKKYQPASLYGIRMGWDIFELAQSSFIEGRNVQTERQEAARTAMDELLERDASFGDLEREIPGFFSTGNALTVDLAKSFGGVITFDEALVQLCIMDQVWYRANGQRGVSGIAMPRTHWLNLMKIFRGSASDLTIWKWAMEMFPWLANPVLDDRLLTASPTNGPIWQMWSADSSELYLEAFASPMLFGPFDTSDLTTDFIMLGQTGGCVNRRYERIVRFNQPA